MTEVARFRQALESKGIRVANLVLFGSHACGHAHKGSDIDLVVISDDFAALDYGHRIDLLASAIFDVFAPIEAVAATQAEWDSGESRIAKNARDGVSVSIGAQPGAIAEVRLDCGPRSR